MIVNLRIGHDLPGTTLILEHVKFCGIESHPRRHGRRLSSLAMTYDLRFKLSCLEVESNSETSAFRQECH